MIYAITGSGGKTTLIHRMADYYRDKGYRVLVTTSTHMMIEDDSLLTDDPDAIIRQLDITGYAMAGIRSGDKLSALSCDTYRRVSEHADITLIEADGSNHRPIKYPNTHEPVIYDNVDEIIVVCGLAAIGGALGEVAHRPELAAECLDTGMDETVRAEHIQMLLRKGYIERLMKDYPNKSITIHPVCDGSLYQRALSGLLRADLEVDTIRSEWFRGKPSLFVCGGGHVALELAHIASILDFDITVMDDREEYANRERFPMADRVICDRFDSLGNYLQPGAFYVVVTRGHQDDYECVRQILEVDYAYLGMIGSRTKVERTRERLGDLNGRVLHAPVGLPIGAATPGEIAVSIMAEIIAVKNTEFSAHASSELINTDRSGVLCIIIDKEGSSPRGVGSMMLVTEDAVIDSIGGGLLEAEVIEDARAVESACIKSYELDNRSARELGMICGGANTILFIPV